MLIGTGLIVGGSIALAGAIGWDMIEKRNKGQYKPDDDNDKYTRAYTKLFTNLGIMDAAAGDWVRFVSKKETDNYKQMQFRVSDTLTVKAIKSKSEAIAEKMHVDNLEVGVDKGLLTFRAYKQGVEPKHYKFAPTAKHLIPLGVDVEGNTTMIDLRVDPHLLVGGASNCGKSTLLNMIILHIMENEAGELWLCDLKDGLEFGDYRECKQVKKYAETIAQARKMIEEVMSESIRRYKFLKDKGYRSYVKYVEALKDGEIDELGRVFVFMDEFADLMQGKNNSTIDDLITLSRKCRAVGIVLVLATQKPTSDSVPTALSANVTGRVGFRVTNGTNSKTIIDETGCEDLENFQCIAILKGKKVRFNTMYLEDKVVMSTIRKYKVHKNLNVEVEKEETGLLGV